MGFHNRVFEVTGSLRLLSGFVERAVAGEARGWPEDWRTTSTASEVARPDGASPEKIAEVLSSAPARNEPTQLDLELPRMGAGSRTGYHRLVVVAAAVDASRC
jgi:hypothetical protein